MLDLPNAQLDLVKAVFPPPLSLVGKKLQQITNMKVACSRDSDRWDLCT